MRNHLAKGCACAAVVLFLVASAAIAQNNSYTFTFTPLNYPQSTRTVASGINNEGTVVGSFSWDYGFIKPPTSGFQKIYNPWTLYLDPYAINDSGLIVGYLIGNGFVRSTNGTLGLFIFPSYTNPAGAYTIASGVNASGHVLGMYREPEYPNTTHSFLCTSGEIIDTDPTNNAHRNDSEIRADQMDDRYVCNAYKAVQYPGAEWTIALGMNNNGDIVGYYRVPNAEFPVYDKAFLYVSSTDTYQTIDYPGAWNPHAQGINNSGQIVGHYSDPQSGKDRGFLKDGNTFVTVDYPAGIGTQPNGINDAGVIVGSYTDTTYEPRGFLATFFPQTTTGPRFDLVLPFAASGIYGIDYTVFTVDPANPTTTFGSFPGEVAAQVDYVGLGLLPEDFSNFTEGHIALIEAGGGGNGLKILNAQNAGAAGVIIYDNVQRRLTNYNLGIQTSIPSVFAANDVGGALIGLLGSGPIVIRMNTNLSPPSISGKVYRADNSTPISGATVEAIHQPDGEIGGRGVTAKDGSYALYLSAGGYRLRVIARGYFVEFYNDVTDANEATTISIDSSSHLQITFRLAEMQPSIFGKVYQTDHTTPIVGATIQAIQLPDGDLGGQDLSAADGSYALYLAPGNYRLKVTAAGYARQFYNNVTASNEATSIAVNASLHSEIDFDLTVAGAISGHIYRKDNGAPIANARIRARPSLYFFDEGFSTTSAADGSYVLTGLPLGKFKVNAEANGFATVRYYDSVYGWGNAIDVIVTPPLTRSNIDIRMEAAGSISGHIYAGDGVTPVAGVSVIADPTINHFEGIGGTSQADGTYRIDGMPPDSYTLRIGENPPGWFAGQFYNGKDFWDDADKVSVSVGLDTPNINFTLSEGGKISGHLYDQSTGLPIAGVQITPELIDGQGVTPLPPTGFDGSFSINLKPGVYHITQNSPAGYIQNWYSGAYARSSATPVTVTLYQITSGIDMYLSRPGSISGNVYRSDGMTPIAGASLYAFPVGPKLPGAGANAQADGSYRINGLPSGTYVVMVAATGYVMASQEVPIVGSADVQNISFLLNAYPYTVVPVSQSVVGASGGATAVGEQSSDLFGASVTIPAGALTENTLITISSVNAPPFPSTLIGIGSPVHFGPEGLTFAAPVTISIPFTEQELDAAGVTDPQLLEVYTYSMSAQAWILVEGARTVDTEKKLIRVQVLHFSIFRIGVKKDTTPPVITPSMTGTLGMNGWYVSGVDVSWNISDPESGIASSTGCASTTLTTDTVGVTLTCSATNGVGLTSSVPITIKIDKTPPVVTFKGNATTYAVDQTVNITCSASDSLAGIESTNCKEITGPAYSFSLGINDFSAKATDKAGNVGNGATSFTVQNTFASLCSLTRQFVKKTGVADNLCEDLNAAAAAAARGNAKAKAAALGSYINDVKAQSGKALTHDQADILIRLAGTL